jgi:histidinol-phosphatase
MRNKHQEYLDFAVELAREAGRITLEYFRQDPVVEMKADHSPVTKADRSAEEYMRKTIAAKYPKHGILGEELGETNPGARFRWIIDPIDGTKSFIHGVALYTVLVGLEISGESHLGVIHCPPTDETIYAATGLGCSLNGKPCHVRKCGNLENAYVHTSCWAELQKRRPVLTKTLLDSGIYAQTWGDGYGYLLVASGRADVMIDPIMNLWDKAAIQPVVLEAGGAFTDLNGNDSLYTDSSLATAGPLHKTVLEMAGKDNLTADLE